MAYPKFSQGAPRQQDLRLTSSSHQNGKQSADGLPDRLLFRDRLPTCTQHLTESTSESRLQEPLLESGSLQHHTDMSIQPPEWSSRQPLGYFALPAQDSSEFHQHHVNSNSSGALSLGVLSNPQQHSSDQSVQPVCTSSVSIPPQPLPMSRFSLPQLLPPRQLETSGSTSQPCEHSAAFSASAMQRNLIGQALLTAASVPLDTAKPALDEHHVPHPFLSPSASYAPQGLSETLLAADPAPQIKSDGEADTATSGSLDAANSSVQMDSVPELTVPNQSIPVQQSGDDGKEAVNASKGVGMAIDLPFSCGATQHAEPASCNKASVSAMLLQGVRSRELGSAFASADHHVATNMKKMKLQSDQENQDQDDMDDNEEERRRRRRRVTNRESAKRIRDKREEQMHAMHAQMTQLEARNTALVSHMHAMEDCCIKLIGELKSAKETWCETCVDNVKLYKKIFELRKALNPGASDSAVAGSLVVAEGNDRSPTVKADSSDVSAEEQGTEVAAAARPSEGVPDPLVPTREMTQAELEVSTYISDKA